MPDIIPFEVAKALLLERISERIRVDTATGCWLWQGPPDIGGYGRCYYKGKEWKAHRLIYTLLVDIVPTKLDLDHLCRIKLCVNPHHMEPVTRAVNITRGQLPGREKTKCKWGHPFTEENTYLQGTKRSCKTCRLENNRKWYARATSN